jgi:hypothetical protein
MDLHPPHQSKYPIIQRSDQSMYGASRMEKNEMMREVAHYRRQMDESSFIATSICEMERRADLQLSFT